MTDSKTEWIAKPSYEGWCVQERAEGRWGMEDTRLIADGLDKPTALKIAAVNEMEAALVVAQRALHNSPATYEHEIPVIDAALAKARGEGDD